MRIFVAALLIFIFVNQSTAQGIEFFEGSWEEALAEAQKQDKIIFVDAYAVWCGPCKRMSREVFTDESVGSFYNKNFINVKMDMERGEGLTFRKKYPVSAFPTLFYIDYSGEIVQRVRGARPADAFLELGRAALSKIDRSQQFAEAYEQGDRSPELVYNYIKALNKAGKSSLKIANEYLRSQSTLDAEENLRIIFEGATEADSKVFEWLTEYREPIIRLESESAFKEKVLAACRTTVDKAVEFEYRDLIEDAIAKMKKYYPGKAEAFELDAEMEYALAMDDAKSYAKACKSYARKIAKNDPKALHRLAQSMVLHFREDDYTIKQAEGIAGDAARKGSNYTYYLTYASILSMNGKKAEADKAIDQSMELAKIEGPQAVRSVEIFKKKFEG